MPLIGLAIGAPIARTVGSAAEYIAAIVLAATGIWMLVSDDDDEAEAAGRMLAATGWSVVALGLSISLDELAIGFTLGLSRLPVVAVIVAIGIQALVATQLGLLVGHRLGRAWRERAEKLAGALLILLGIGLATTQLLD